MIYDCFTFNTELDLLQLRLDFLFDDVDFFVIVESSRTHSGQAKDLIFKENQARYSKYASKIIYLEAPPKKELQGWEYEHYQRNFLKEGLTQCDDNDIVFVSDLDEIINIKHVLSKYSEFPARISMNLYYYFFNLKSNSLWNEIIVCNYKHIKDIDIGDRSKYKFLASKTICNDDSLNGWHFSYLFGFDIEKYQHKISSNAHQEFNTDYFTNRKRIEKCLQMGLDLFERPDISYSFESRADLSKIYVTINKLNLNKYFYEPNVSIYFKVDNLTYLINRHFIPVTVWKLRSVFGIIKRKVQGKLDNLQFKFFS